MNKALIKRTWILAMMTILGLSLVWLIPNSGEFKKSKLVQDLPERLDNRLGVKLKISEKEREILAADTTFARKRYYVESTSSPYIDISVVFSGKDINNSIHRPEVCLKAQGWNFESEKFVSLDADGMTIPFKEIVCLRPRIQNDHLPHKNSKGEVIVDRRVQYYTFVGTNKIVAGHYERTWEDIKLRVLEGTDQQWAYITLSMDVKHSTDIPAAEKTGYDAQFVKLDLEETRELLNNFVSQVMPTLLSDE